MMISSRHRLPRWPAEYAALSLLLLAPGCSSLSTRPASNSRRLHPLPSVSPDFPLSERALFAAFYAANGVSLTPAQAEEILPAALPEILTGMRIAVGFGWTTLVAAELVAATVGLGQLVMNASNFLRTDIVLMGILVIGIVAWVFDLGMRGIERYLVPWKGRV